MNFKPLIKRTLIGIAALIVLMVSSGVVITYFYQEEIIQFFIKEANKKIDTPVKVGNIQLSLFKHFPNATIVLNHIEIQPSGAESDHPLAKAENLNFAFNLADLLSGRYDLKDIYLENAEVFIGLDEKGKPNYNIINKTDSSSDGGGSTFFNLESITLKDVKVHYDDFGRNQHFSFFTHNSKASLKQLGPATVIHLTGELHTNEIDVDGQRYFSDKDVNTDTDLVYDNQTGIVDIKSGDLSIDKGQFQVTGMVDTKKQSLNLDVKGKKANLTSLISLLPYKEARIYQGYRSRGEVYFRAAIKGKYGSLGSPDVNVDFGPQILPSSIQRSSAALSRRHSPAISRPAIFPNAALIPLA